MPHIQIYVLQAETIVLLTGITNVKDFIINLTISRKMG